MILITGATGNVGGELVRRMLTHSVEYSVSSTLSADEISETKKGR